MLAWLGFAHCFLYIALRITSDWNMGHSCYIEKGRNCVCVNAIPNDQSMHKWTCIEHNHWLSRQAHRYMHINQAVYIYASECLADGMSRSNMYAAPGCLNSLQFPLHDVYIEIWIFGRGCWQCVHSQMRNMRRCLMMCWKEWEMSTHLNIQQAKSKRTAIPAK